MKRRSLYRKAHPEDFARIIAFAAALPESEPKVKTPKPPKGAKRKVKR